MTDEERSPASFADLGLGPDLLRAIEEHGFEAATPIQEATIGLLMSGKDVIGQAQTGTGKTAAFALPMLERLDPDAVDERGRHKVQGLVLAPTRELAVQVAEATHRLGRHLGATVLPIYGGQPIDRQLRALRSGVQIVVGTPGRVMDHMRRGTLDVSNVKVLVLDEADEMLAMGFVEDIEWILEEVPAERQMALFSATMPPRIRALSKKYMRDAEHVQVSTPGKVTVPQIEQCYVDVTRHNKVDALGRILDYQDPESVIIFCRTKSNVDELTEHLLGRGYPAEALHGDLSQVQRDRVMKRFREGNLEILVATDVAARGLDVENVSHVINYDMPDSPDAYVHRIGRTARAGRKGIAITFVMPRERHLWGVIQRVVGKRIKPMHLPTAADIVAQRLEALKNQVRETVKAGQLDSYLTMVADLEEELDPGEIAAGFAKIAAEATQPRSLAGQSLDGDGARPEAGMARLFIGAGRQAGIRPADVVGAIANETGLPGRQIGAIDIFPDYTFVEVPADRRDEIIRVLAGSTIKGVRVRVDIAGVRDEAVAPSGDVRERGDLSAERGRTPAARPVRRPPPSWEREEQAGPRRRSARREDGSEARGAARPPWLRRS